MGITTALWSFALVVGLLTLTPGLDTALILRTAALGERARAWGVVLGINTGTMIWGAASSLGISALLTASRLAYETLRWAGVAYLLWIGLQMLCGQMLRGSGTPGPDPEPDTGTGGFGAGWRRGALTNLLNPKVGVFYVAVLPQFIPAGVPHLPMGVLLTSVHVAEGLVWSAVLVAFARAIRGWLRRPAARKLMDRLTGVVVVGFGLRLATTD
ncbi:threonine/homoserine/homoserine lactone efflux protein [Kitasatospora gansuensis]|uniref:Threonine/homoserine/homoserine lactone efflux protein n=1 Tax=Kitasatospora gansuensis TaxID=258050 RepID=A0A7W7S896_9ACTN|nr:LysE family translocator [Kitasatospora gansuensis]MBB4945669.1 threonine/homoserine/homoserine lactone efflux protein [Kitasatospora gansuensis]